MGLGLGLGPEAHVARPWLGAYGPVGRCWIQWRVGVWQTRQLVLHVGAVTEGCALVCRRRHGPGREHGMRGQARGTPSHCVPSAVHWMAWRLCRGWEIGICIVTVVGVIVGHVLYDAVCNGGLG